MSFRVLALLAGAAIVTLAAACGSVVQDQGGGQGGAPVDPCSSPLLQAALASCNAQCSDPCSFCVCAGGEVTPVEELPPPDLDGGPTLVDASGPPFPDTDASPWWDAGGG